MNKILPIICPLTYRERELCDEMRVRGGYANDADLVRVALWRHAEQLDCKPALGDFEVRGKATPRRVG